MTNITIAFNRKAPRKVRRAMTSLRWEKKMRKFLEKALGYPVTAIRRRPA
jgi:hypothetical protein